MMDYLIKNGLIIDGSGKEPLEANIGIKGDRISFVGKALVDAREVIDAGGLIVSPGFIDTHTHSEFTLLADGRAEAKVSQGVTTEVSGNCGLSAAPLYGEALEQREADLEELGIKERWGAFGEYFSMLESKGITINFATLCGHGNIRGSVVGYKNRRPDKEEMAEMKRLLSEALKQGAKGLSTGLIYPPGVYSETGELIGLCSELRTPNSELIYASHIRSEGDKLIESIEEIIEIGRKTGAHVHISHIKTSGKDNWHKIDEVIGLVEQARLDNIQLTCDRYPYIASSTDLDAIFPPWVHEGGRDAALRRLNDPATRETIKREILAIASRGGDDYWKRIFIASVTKDENKWMEGKDVLSIARKTSAKPDDTVINILIDEGLCVGAIFFTMSEENLKRFILLPYVMIGSDSSARSFSGITRSGKPHPRGFGTFPRFIGKYVRDEAIMPLHEAIHKITHLPAETFGLKHRGLIKEGYYADIVVFNYENIIDKATFDDPFQRGDGIEYVFVNGVLAFKKGTFTDSLSGSILK